MDDTASSPNLIHERQLWAEGYRCIAGLDEAGRGAWAGPVVAAAVVLPPGDPDLVQHMAGVRDSKMLTARQRETLLEVIQRHAVGWGVGAVSSAQIDELGIVPAVQLAMALAVQGLSPPAEYLLIDYLSLPNLSLPQKSLLKGDTHVLSIAAASVVAKVARDCMMVELETRLPGYGFGQHKGYGTAQHRTALASLGPSVAHRFSFAPVRGLVPQGNDPASTTPHRV